MSRESGFGKLSPSQGEKDLLVRWHNESAGLRGVFCTYYPVAESVANLYSDRQIVYEDPVELYIHLDQYPSIKFLRNLGWYVEDKDNLPILAYLPHSTYGQDYWTPHHEAQPPVPDMEYLPVKRGAKLVLHSNVADSLNEREFIVTDTRTGELPHVATICKLAPVRMLYQPTEHSEGQDPNYQYLKRKNENIVVKKDAND